jgi:hypothetical protein
MQQDCRSALSAHQRLAVIVPSKSRFDACFDLHNFVSPFQLTMLQWLQSNPVGNLSEFRAFFCLFFNLETF